ncbi:VOC family protein [Andreprevotia chitinilytica]|uniref:VOC family protein n=1 Tax=Andreprevotia chitinilytica TaxID=396808 RepID=UPI000551473D|nr:VOC family protein [Andreprevotia chitinilytica]
MQLGYTLFYVADVPATVVFYEQAFSLPRRFVHESNMYAEMETGSTALAFADEKMADMHGLSIRAQRPDDTPASMEICLVTDDPMAAYAHAVAHGAHALKAPEQKPWGQIVGYVRDLNGYLVEICSPVSA